MTVKTIFLCIFFSTVNAIYQYQYPLEVNPDNDACTAIAVGPTAGTTGPMTTHNMDCLDCDFRINKVPAANWPEGSMRPLYLLRDEYPQLVTDIRGETWKTKNLEGTKEQVEAWANVSFQGITGYIPEVANTYALIEGGYGMMNEWGVSIGESTCQAKFWNAPINAGGNGVIEISQLSRIALERTKTAVDAIQLMGELATSLGYYSCTYEGGVVGDYLGEGGEALTVVDTTEAWMFHILPDDTGTSAVWVAQRVPDNHVTVVANQFVIRLVDPNNTDFMYSDNLWDVAERNNFWDPSMGLLDFTPTYAPERAHSKYCTRRVWRVFSLVSPSWALTPSANNGVCSDTWCTQFPFSVQVDNVLAPADIMVILRDHYEGSTYDLTQGLAAGPYGEPNRWDAGNSSFPMTLTQELNGSFERPISMFRTSTSIIAEPRSALPAIIGCRLWFTQYAPSASVYTPLYVSAKSLPKEFTKGSLFKYDSDVAWWNFAAAGNYASKFYEFAMQSVQELQSSIETSTFTTIEELEEKALSKYQDGHERDVIDMLGDYSKDLAESTVKAYKDLLPILLTTYHDGYIASDLNATTINMVKIFYPYWWLEAVGYQNDRPNAWWEDPNMIEFSRNPDVSSFTFYGVAALVVGTSLLSLSIGFTLGMKANKNSVPYMALPTRGAYQVVPDDHGIALKAHTVDF